MKKILSLFLCFLTIFFCAGCGREVDDYSAKEHAQRIRQRIEKNGWGTNKEAKNDKFEVYPLYDQKDELMDVFLVEFETFGFAFVYLADENISFSCIARRSSMYLRGAIYGKSGNLWSPYKVDENKSPGYSEDDMQWILDENGERIYYDKSPYFVTGNINEKKYLIRAVSGSSACICAVKKGGIFINLIDGQTVDFSVEDFSKGQAVLGIGGVYKPQFVL